MTKINLAPQASAEETYNGGDKDSLFRRKIMKTVRVLDGQLQTAVFEIQPDRIAATVMNTTAFGDFAGSKQNKVQYQATAPTVKPDGTLWMDTSETPNILKRWDSGTQTWVPTAYNQSEIEQLANSISLTVTSSAISPIDSRLSTAEGTLVVQAGQIASKVSTTDLNSTLTNYSTIIQTADKVALEIGNVQIGGRNLISNSGFEEGYGEFGKNNGVETFMDGSIWTTHEGKNFLIIISANVASGGAYRFLTNLVTGRTYTFSAWVWCDGGTWSIGVSDGTLIRENTAGWHRITQTFVAGSGSHILYFLADTVPVQSTLYIDNIQLEEGNKATAWRLNNSEMRGAKYIFDGSKARFYSDGQEWYDDSGVLQVYFDTVNHRYVFKGRIESSSGLIAGWSIGTSTISKGGVKLDSANERIYFGSTGYLYAYNGTSTIGVSNALDIQGQTTIRGATIANNTLLVRFTSGGTLYTLSRDANGFVKAV